MLELGCTLTVLVVSGHRTMLVIKKNKNKNASGKENGKHFSIDALRKCVCIQKLIGSVYTERERDGTNVFVKNMVWHVFGGF